MHLFVLREEAKQPGRWKGLRVLELGAGTGLVGLTFAVCGAKVVLTELPAALPLLQHNVNANASVCCSNYSSSLSLPSSAGDPTAPAATPAAYRNDDDAADSPDRLSFPLVAALEWSLPLEGIVRDLVLGDGATENPSEGSKDRSRSSSSTSRENGHSSSSREDGGRSSGVQGGGGRRRWPFDLVVGADVNYSQDLAEPLLDAIDQVMRITMIGFDACEARGCASLLNLNSAQ